MNQDTIRQTIRERLDAGILPSKMPALTGGPGRPPTPMVYIKADTSIDVAKCSGCGEDGAAVTYRYADGTIVRFHGRCSRVWEEECRRPVASHLRERT